MAAAWSLCLGSVLGASTRPATGICAAALLGGVFLLGARRVAPVALGSLALLGFGAAGLSEALHGGQDRLTQMATSVPRCTLQARVLEHGGGLGTTLGVRAIECPGVRAAGDIGIVVIDGSQGHAGGQMRLRGRLVPLGLDGFSKARADLGAEAEFIVGEVLGTSMPDSIVLSIAARLRLGVGRAGSGMEPRRAALLSGLTIGDTAGLDPPTESTMRRAGLSHLVAVSGSNVAIVVGTALVALRRMGKVAALVAAAATLLIYTLTVGPEPSVLRAAAMGAIVLAALLAGRRAAPLASLGLGLAAVLVARPAMVYSVGLQLSAAATLGLILWARPLAHRLSFLPRPIAVTAAATLSAQAAVAPILLGTFSEISLVAPLANLLALPAVPLATIVGLIAGLVAVASPSLGAIAARVAEPAVAWILTVGNVLGSLPGAAIELPTWMGFVIAIPVVVGVYVTLRREHLDIGTSARRVGI